LALVPMAAEAQITASLSSEAMHVLQKQKRVQKITNEQFFRCHPELKSMVDSFLSKLLKAKPDNPAYFAESFFTQPDLARQLGFEGWTRPPTPAPEAAFEQEIIASYDDGDAEEVVGTTEIDTVDLEQDLIRLFQEADSDGSGFLDFDEFAQVLNTADLGLSVNELKLLLSEADENSDGKVTFVEFVPLAVEVVQVMRLKTRVEEDELVQNESYRDVAASIIALSPEDMEQLVMKAAGGERASGGLLSRPQVKGILRSPQIGLSKRQVNDAASSIEYDGDGMIRAEVLAPTLYQVVEKAVMDALRMQNVGEVGAELTRLCEFYDKSSSGFLDPPLLKQALCQGFSFLTMLQVNALVSDKDVPRNTEGQIAWREHLPKLTAIIKGMGDPEAMMERAELAARAEFQPVELMNGMERAQMDEMLADLFRQADADGNGTLDHQEFFDCMIKADLGFTNDDIYDLIASFDADGDGKISYDEFMFLAYDVLAKLARERALMQAMLHIEAEVLM